MKQIVCLATSPWFPIPTRKQQVMSRIPDAEILYFDPSVSVIAPLKDKKARPMLTAYKKEGFRPQKNITVYSRCFRFSTSPAPSTASIRSASPPMCGRS